MATPPAATPPSALSRGVRERFVGEVDGVIVDMAATAQGRLSALADLPGTAREQQARRDAILDFMQQRDRWITGVRQAWRQAFVSPTAAAERRQVRANKGLTLMEDDVIEDGILISRLGLAITDKVSWEFNDLKLRVLHLDKLEDFTDHEVLKPETFAAVAVNQWTACDLDRSAWAAVQDSLVPLLADRMLAAYKHANEFLIRNGVMPVIEIKPVVRRSAATAPAAEAKASTPPAPPAAAKAASAPPTDPAKPSAPASPPAPAAPAQRHELRAMADETRMMTGVTPLARARQRAQGVLGQLKRMLVDRGADFDETRPGKPSAELDQAIAQEQTARSQPRAPDAGPVQEGDVGQLLTSLRERSTELKKRAATTSEKATIEIVALMFQAILAEERIPPGVRVWFARLQMPVLRVALAEPEFFNTLEHPARVLIDRMGSCAMGFDASGVQGSAMEGEIRRVVQVIEQYPETGRRVFQLVLDEFQKFLSRFLTEKKGTQRVVSVAQQVEQKETLAIQYTIELRSMLNQIKVRDEIREFLFKVWAEAMAVAALRHGAQHADTLALKRAATDLLWAASAKPHREDRTRVIQDLPRLLQQLRKGMALLGLPATAQDAHIKVVSDILADAFLSKTEAIPQEQIDDMAKRLERLEVAISGDDAGDIEIDPGTLEVMLGVEASSFELLANGGSHPSNAMLAWARELDLGQWFVLDHNSKVTQVQLVWRSDRRQLHLFAAADGNTNYLIQARRLAAYLQAGLLVPSEDETLTVRATREALTKLDANPERLLG